MFFFVFFFFKQKTAYEMRISDWSSDVCSSDLAAITVQATISVTGDDAVAATAASTFEQPGEQEGQTAQLVDMLGAIGAHALRDILELLGDLRLSLARRLPQFLIDDAQLDRTSVVWEKSVSERVDLGGRGFLKK